MEAVRKIRHSAWGVRFPQLWTAVRPLWHLAAQVLTAGRGFRHVVNGVDTFRLSLEQGHNTAPLDWEPEQYLDVMSVLRPGDHFLDIGAFWGLFSLGAARRVGATGKVVTVEPGPRQYSLLQKNVRSNGFGSIVVPVEAICSDTAGQAVDFYADPEGSMVDSAVAKPGREATALRRVTTTVDELTARYQLRPRLLKIDVEGFEHQVIRGAQTTLTKYRPVLFIEFHPEEMQACGTSAEALLSELQQLGYRCADLVPGAPVPRGWLFKFVCASAVGAVV